MTDSNTVTLNVGGQLFSGWVSQNVKLQMESIAGSFKLDITDKYPSQPERWDIVPGDACTVKIGDDVVITGYVDIVSIGIDRGSHSISVTGRDKTGDLVDCSIPPREWTNTNFGKLCEDVCAPYGITVLSQISTGGPVTVPKKKASKKGDAVKSKPAGFGALPKHACNAGETVFRLIEKLARIEGVLLVSDGAGNLVITRAGLNGRCTSSLVLGVNVLSSSFEQNHSNLFSEIVVRGQTSSATTAGIRGVNATISKGSVNRGAATASAGSAGNTVRMPAIKRYRPLHITAESNANAARCQERAQWEAAVREAKSRKYSCTVQGWREQDGDLWRINRVVRVVDNVARIDADMLIAGVDFTIDSQGGRVAKLVCYPPEAFNVLKEIPAPSGVGAGKPLRGVNKNIK